MDYLITLLVSVAADVVSHFICKWLDKYDKNRKAEKGKPPWSCSSEGAFPLGVKPMDYLYTFCFYYMRFPAKVKRCTESLQS